MNQLHICKYDFYISYVLGESTQEFIKLTKGHFRRGSLSVVLITTCDERIHLDSRYALTTYFNS